MRLVTVVPLKSFDDFMEGVARTIYLNERVANLIAMDYLRLVWDSAWEGPSDAAG